MMDVANIGDDINMGLFLLLNLSQIICELICEENFSEDEEAVADIIDMYPLLTRGEKPTRISYYFEIIIPNLTEKQFQQHFRVTIEAFDYLENMIAPLICSKENAHRKTVNERKQILMVLWLLATPDSYRSIGERFDVGKSTLWACFYRVIKALNQISTRLIVWPNAERRLEIVNDLRFGAIPNVIGAVDGTYVPIKAPKENPEVYINRKCFHGITLQGICDTSLKFLHIFVGYPSSVSDNRIFRNSDIHNNILENPNEYLNPEQILLGDKAYPVYKWLIPPYINRGNLNGVERYFNTIHASMRQTIERSFALFFGRMRRMQYLDMNRFDLYAYVIKAACVIHNLCLLKTDYELENYILEGLPRVRQNQVENIENNPEEANLFANLANEGRNRRDQIALNLYRVNGRD